MFFKYTWLQSKSIPERPYFVRFPALGPMMLMIIVSCSSRVSTLSIPTRERVLEGPVIDDITIIGKVHHPSSLSFDSLSSPTSMWSLSNKNHPAVAWVAISHVWFLVAIFSALWKIIILIMSFWLWWSALSERLLFYNCRRWRRNVKVASKSNLNMGLQVVIIGIYSLVIDHS